jgi:lipoate synthase
LSTNDFELTLQRVGEVLDRLGIEHAIVGSVASSKFGENRATNDVDVVLNMKKDSIQAFASSLRPDFYVDEELILEALDRHSSFNILHIDTGTKFDFFALKPRAYDLVALKRRTQETPAYMRPEDVLLGKLEWFKATDETSERQWRDVKGILQISQDFDHAYTKRWAEEIGVLDLLERVLKEIQ